jgi:myosin heavy subunit
MKPLIFLGMLLAIGAVALAFMTRDELKKAREQKDNLNRSTLQAHESLREQIGTITTTNDAYTTTSKNAKNEDIQTKSLVSDTKGKEEELAAINKEIEEIVAKKQAMQEVLNSKVGGGTPEELLAKNEALKKENDAKVEEIDQITKEADVAKKASIESDNLVARLKQQQATRAKAITLASRSGTVSAVNPDFGFVIVNFGQNQGVSSESRLLVKRGNQLIGKLNIVQIEGNTTVADIAVKSLTPGFSVEPGDEVVFENSPT